MHAQAARKAEKRAARQAEKAADHDAEVKALILIFQQLMFLRNSAEEYVNDLLRDSHEWLKSQVLIDFGF